MTHDPYYDPHRHYRSETAWRAQQEDLDRQDAIQEHRELPMDEFRDSPLSRVTMQRLRNAHDEGRTLVFRSEWGRGMCCVAQRPLDRPTTIYQDYDSVRFRRMRVEIERFWERLNENRTGNN